MNDEKTPKKPQKPKKSAKSDKDPARVAWEMFQQVVEKSENLTEKSSNN